MGVSIPPAIVKAVEDHTGSKASGFSPASGGCINNAGRITTSHGEYFLKWNNLNSFPRMLDAERRGLLLLRESNALTVPSVVHSGAVSSYQFLLLEYIQQGRRSKDYWETFGRGLAKMHTRCADTYGLDYDNYIGSLSQSNRQSTSWVDFFISQRLDAQLRLAVEKGAIDRSVSGKFAKLFGKLPSLIPDEPPALLHGDLWGGNILTTADGSPCLIDPAVYYGHREVDLAMTQLFGGFDSSFFDSYEEVSPLLPGYRERLDLYNLYPLLVHVNLFGGGYAGQVMSVLNRFL